MYVQVVFSVKYREYLVGENHREEVEKVMCGMITHRSCTTLAIYCNPDHVHILISFHPTISVADLMRDIKSGSSKLINEKKWYPGTFRWQDGYASFTYSKNEIGRVIDCIKNQPRHHKKQNFREEYLQTLKENNILFAEKYAF